LCRYAARENPTPADDPNDQFFLGDNAKRKTGDTLGFERMNEHAYDAYQKAGAAYSC
jgi:pre-mRNA-processing factor SLU7